jgi:mannose-6-phosphate isomerase
LTSVAHSKAKTPTGAGAYPLHMEPRFVERVWGAPSDSVEVASLFPPAHSTSATARPNRVGEVWLTGNENRIANGSHAGKTLKELTAAYPESLLGAGRNGDHPSGAAVFPLLVKFLFTTDKLSVQVHPPDASAAAQQSWGKTEMWHILRAAPGAQLAIGFRKDIRAEFLSDPANLRDAAASGELEQMLDWQEVHAGETYFIPAGTVHAIGAGLTLCEIQQNSDITYRLYDYNRPGTDGRSRPLHVEEALQVIRWPSAGGRTSPLEWALDRTGATHTCQLLAACPYFVTERWDCVQLLRPALGGASRDADAVSFGNTNRPEIWITLQEAAEFEADGVCVRAQAGEAIIIPAAVTAYDLRPQSGCVLLRTYPPDWEADVLTPLRAAGLSPEQRERVCFPLSEAGEDDSR